MVTLARSSRVGVRGHDRPPSAGWWPGKFDQPLPGEAFDKLGQGLFGCAVQVAHALAHGRDNRAER
jgi:hypothetical protein